MLLLFISLYKSYLNLYCHPVLYMGNFLWQFCDLVLPFVFKDVLPKHQWVPPRASMYILGLNPQIHGHTIIGHYIFSGFEPVTSQCFLHIKKA